MMWNETRIQPCLLRRLTDEEPSQKKEAPERAAVSIDDYASSVEMDVLWLLSTCAPPLLQPKSGMAAPSNYYLNPEQYAEALRSGPMEGLTQWVDLRCYPETMNSVLVFGARQVMNDARFKGPSLEIELKRLLAIFEPRVLVQSVETVQQLTSIKVTISGELIAFPSNRDFLLRARIYQDTGHVEAEKR